VPNAETWVLEYQDRPVSFITLVGDETRGLFLDPASHGKGLGRAMVDHIVALKSLMHIEVFEKNDIG
jgi:putative acetyltransferase